MSGIKWVDIVPNSTDITTVYVGHSADLDNRSIGSRMGGAARDAARTLTSRIERVTGQTVRIRTQRHGDRVQTEMLGTPVTVQRYRMVPTVGELKVSYVMTWEDRPCSTAHSLGEVEAQVRRRGKPAKVVRKLAYWWGEHDNGTRAFEVLTTEDLSSSFE